MSSPLLRLRGIAKRFGGVQALDRVDFAVDAGVVQCVVGENGSGKSTLIKIATGALPPDEGAIEIAGRSYSTLTPRLAIRHGIEAIYQDLALFPNLTVAENIALARYLGEETPFFRAGEARAVARRAMDYVGVRLDPDAVVDDLSMADKQITAICRALARDARVIFMDEPTAALTWREVESLFRVIRHLTAREVAVVFVSHKLDEVLAIGDRVTVLRNGLVVAHGPRGTFDRRTLVHAMTGRAVLDQRQIRPVSPDAPVLLAVQRLTLAGVFEDISFRVRQGEILGFAGLLGSGAVDVLETLFGVRRADAGEVIIGGERRTIRDPSEAVAWGIGYVPGDRLAQGLFLRHSVTLNVMASTIDAAPTRWGCLRWGAVGAVVGQVLAALRVAAPSAAVPVAYLSGGNQQRVVLARWIMRAPRILLLNGPTVGVDVGSKEEIHQLLRELSERGIAMLIASDDIPELVALCHRILVMRRGRVSGELVGAEITEDALTHALQA